MRNPRDFNKPLAVGAPEPVLEVPFTPSRMIHFFDPSNEKIVDKLPDLATKADIVLGNLEDAIAVENKEAAREGLVRVGKEMDLGQAALWTRVNSLESPWVLDDLTRLVTAIGDRLDVIMVPKVEGAWDIHYVDRLLAQLEARTGIERPIMVHALLETGIGVVNLEEIATASPRMQGMSFGPADLAASRRMKTTRVGGGHPGYLVINDPDPDDPDAPRPTAQLGFMFSWAKRTALPALVIFAAGAIAAPFVIPIIDEGRYPLSVTVFQVMLLMAFAYLVTMPNSSLLMTQKRYHLLAWVNTAALAVNVSAAAAVAAPLGVVGVAAVATVVAFGQVASVTYLAAHPPKREGSSSTAELVP